MLDITDLLTDEDVTAEYSVTPSFDRLSYKFGDFPVTDKKPFTLQMTRGKERKLSVEFEAELEVEIPCARCLTPVKSRIVIRPEELEIDLDDNEYIDGDYLDVDQLIHDEALLVWPERTLCRSDCKGLCISCGKNLNEGPYSCNPAVLDPRMAKILDIFENSNEEV